MKQTIREQTFETNSSSYHSVTIHSVESYKPAVEIEKGKITELDGEIIYKTIGSSSSYSYTSRSMLDKANMLLRVIASDIEGHWIYDQPDYDNIVCKFDYRSDERKKAYIDLVQTCPMIVALKDSISNYTNAATIIKFDTTIGSPYLQTVYDCDNYLHEILHINRGDLDDVDRLTEVFTDIIFNDKIQITEECESND